MQYVECVLWTYVVQLMQAFSRVKSGYLQNQVSALKTECLRSMGNIACGMSAADIAVVDPSEFWYDRLTIWPMQ